MREPFFFRHDLHVVLPALVILALGGIFHETGGERTRPVSRDRLSVEVPAGWLAEPTTGATVLRGEDAVTRLELRVVEPPGPLVSVETALELERAQRHGPLYTRGESGAIDAGGREWLRTTFSYAFKPTPTHAPRLAAAVEYARVEAGRLHVVTLHAPPERIAELEHAILPSVRLR